MDAETDETPETTRTDRRRFVKALGALGVAGLAGCGGDGTDESTETTTPEETTEPIETTAPKETTEPMETTTPETDTGTPTETGTPAEDLGEDPAKLLSLTGTTVPVGETATLNGTLTNPYLFDIHSVEVTVDSPGDDWTVSATGDTSFDTIDVSGEQTVGWETTPPEDASGDYVLSFNVTYESDTDQADVTVEQSLTVFTPGEAPEDGLIAHFPLEGAPPADTVSGAEGTLMGGPVTDAEGVVGSAYEFDGEDDFVSLPEFGADASSMTISMWVNTENWGNDITHLLFMGGPIPDHTGFEFWTPEGSTAPELFYWDGGSVNLIAGAGSTPPTGQWVHLCAVYDDEAGMGAIYVNGEESGSQSVQFNIELEPVDNTLAAHPQGEPATRHFQGRIDDLRVYDRPLTEAEVASIAG